MSSATRIQLHFSHFKITVKTTMICPKFDIEVSQIISSGCYDCPFLSRLTFTTHTPYQSNQSHITKFVVEQKCYAGKLCLKSNNLVQCQNIHFCLVQPSMELLAFNTMYQYVHTVKLHELLELAKSKLFLLHYSSSVYLYHLLSCLVI